LLPPLFGSDDKSGYNLGSAYFRKERRREPAAFQRLRIKGEKLFVILIVFLEYSHLKNRGGDST
jgi:hypothetical protein